MMDGWDTNEDGKLDIAEVLEMAVGKGSQENVSSELEAEARAFFEQADRDQDDHLSPEEFEEFTALVEAAEEAAEPTPVPTPQPTPYIPTCVQRDSDWGGSCECRPNEYLQYCDDGWTYDTAVCCSVQNPSPGCRRVDSGYGPVGCGGLCSPNEF